MGRRSISSGTAGGSNFGFLDAVYLDPMGVHVTTAAMAIFGTQLRTARPRDVVARTI